MTMKIGSLFSGIGGLELGLERAISNATTVWQVESNGYARSILAKHWPNAQRYNNVRKVGAQNLKPVDLICGGFPCQDISAANTKAIGINGSRSALWFEYARIVRELRPKIVVVENVPALLNRGMGVVLGDLAACGYDAMWDCIPASAVGAKHRRDRVFIVAWSASNAVSFGHRAPQTIQFQPSIIANRGWAVEPHVGRVATGVPNRVDRLRCLGNAVVPQVAEVIGRVVMDIDQHCVG